jgi:hypothetical protein
MGNYRIGKHAGNLARIISNAQGKGRMYKTYHQTTTGIRVKVPRRRRSR